MTTPGSRGFGDLLKHHRVAAGLTQEALAGRAGLSARGISDLERGINRAPRFETIHLLAEALHLTAQDRRIFEAAARVSGPGSVAIGGAPRATPGPAHGGSDLRPLVGRARELALLQRHLAGEGPPLLLLAGEPGIGKSRLLREAMARAPAQGWTVLEGGCQRRGGQELYAPLLGAIQRHLRTRSPSELRAALQDCAWLAKLLPELADGASGVLPPLPAWSLPPEQERRLMFEAVIRFLANAAGPSGTLLVLDDLQWAGPDALDLLAALARAATEAPLRVVGAYRDTEIGVHDPLMVMLADLAHAELAMHAALGPLTSEEARDLLDSLLEGSPSAAPALREQVLQRTGGLPFFLVSCARALEASPPEGDAERVPWSLAQSIRQRVAALPEEARAVLGVAAVVGRVVPHSLLLAVASRPEEQVHAALEAACRARLLQEEERGYQFVHDVVREVVEADLGLARRAALHRRIGEALAQRPGEPPLELLVYHYCRSEDREQAVRYLELAAERARTQYAHASAEGYYRELVERLDGLGRSLEVARARGRLGAILRLTARYKEALAVLEPAAAVFEAAGDLENQGWVMAQIGRVLGDNGTPEEGIQRIQPALRALSAQGPSPGLAALYLTLTELCDRSGRFDEQLAAAEHTARIARAVGDDRALAEAVCLRGQALDYLGRIEESVSAFEAAVRLAEAAGEYTSLCRALQFMAMYRNWRGDFEASRGSIERALEAAERLGNPADAAVTLGMRGLHAMFPGDWGQARADGEHALAMCRRTDGSFATTYVLCYLGGICLWQGEWEDAAAYLKESWVIAEATADRIASQVAQVMLAEWDLREGRASSAMTRLASVPDHNVFGVTNLAWAHAELGNMAEAEAAIAQAASLTTKRGWRTCLVEALRVEALLAMRQDQADRAEAVIAEALGVARDIRYPYGEARALHQYGLLEFQRGEPGTARKHLEAARAIFRRLGARKDIERVEQELATLRTPPA